MGNAYHSFTNLLAEFVEILFGGVLFVHVFVCDIVFSVRPVQSFVKGLSVSCHAQAQTRGPPWRFWNAMKKEVRPTTYLHHESHPQSLLVMLSSPGVVTKQAVTEPHVRMRHARPRVIGHLSARRPATRIKKHLLFKLAASRM